ncbi:hypothetical protein L195_g064099, partial [Trifolium pratense]
MAVEAMGNPRAAAPMGQLS